MQKCTAQDCNIFIFRNVVRCSIIFNASWKDNDRSLVRFFNQKGNRNSTSYPSAHSISYCAQNTSLYREGTIPRMGMVWNDLRTHRWVLPYSRDKPSNYDLTWSMSFALVMFDRHVPLSASLITKLLIAETDTWYGLMEANILIGISPIKFDYNVLIIQTCAWDISMASCQFGTRGQIKTAQIDPYFYRIPNRTQLNCTSRLLQGWF